MKTELIETDQVNLTRTQSANKIPYGFDDMRKIIDEKNVNQGTVPMSLSQEQSPKKDHKNTNKHLTNE